MKSVRINLHRFRAEERVRLEVLVWITIPIKVQLLNLEIDPIRRHTRETLKEYTK